MGRLLTRRQELYSTEIGSAVHRHSPIAPRLRCDPFDCVVAVGAFHEEEPELTVGSAQAPNILEDDGVAGLDIGPQTIALEFRFIVRVRCTQYHGSERTLDAGQPDICA